MPDSDVLSIYSFTLIISLFFFFSFCCLSGETHLRQVLGHCTVLSHDCMVHRRLRLPSSVWGRNEEAPVLLLYSFLCEGPQETTQPH